jgi:hypothetical protein
MRERSGGFDQLCGELPEVLVRGLVARIFADGEEAGEDADDVAVEDWCRRVEGDAGNCPGGVAAHAGQREHGVEIARKLACVRGNDELRGLLHVPHARVVAEPLPEFQEPLLRRGGERGHIGQFAHPALPIRDDRLHLSLLEHDFTDPDGVRVERAPPREVAGGGGEPVEEQLRNAECGMWNGRTRDGRGRL